jgi:hypothetical protein
MQNPFGSTKTNCLRKSDGQADHANPVAMRPHRRIDWQSKRTVASATFAFQLVNSLLKLAELCSLPIQFQLVPIQTAMNLL